MTSSLRKFLKALSWRCIGIVSLYLISFAMSGSWKFSGTLTLFHAVIQVVLYYLHENLWDRLKWGKLRGVAVQMTGLPSSGKSTIAQGLKRRLESRGLDVEVIDGDEYRTTLCSDLGFSKRDRIENIRRLSFVAHKLAGTGRVSIIAAINPYEEARGFLKKHSDKHVTAHVHAPLDVVVSRDVKGLYARALKPTTDPDHLPNFTGVSDTYEVPSDPDVVLNTHEEDVDQCVAKLERLILKRMRG